MSPKEITRVLSAYDRQSALMTALFAWIQDGIDVQNMAMASEDMTDSAAQFHRGRLSILIEMRGQLEGVLKENKKNDPP